MAQSKQERINIYSARVKAFKIRIEKEDDSETIWRLKILMKKSALLQVRVFSDMMWDELEARQWFKKGGYTGPRFGVDFGGPMSKEEIVDLSLIYGKDTDQVVEGESRCKTNECCAIVAYEKSARAYETAHGKPPFFKVPFPMGMRMTDYAVRFNVSVEDMKMAVHAT